MANQNKPSGLTPLTYLNGADWDGRGNVYTIVAADVNAFYPGDLVALNGTSSADGIPGITQATAAAPAVGVVLAVGINKDSVYIDPNNLSRVFRPALAQAINYYALVCDDPNVIFEAQENAGTITAAQAARNVNIVYAAPATGVVVSGTMIASASQAVTAGLNLKLLGPVRRYNPDGTFNGVGANCKWRCLINNHQYKGTGVLGV